jgi:hypothetical protein
LAWGVTVGIRAGFRSVVWKLSRIDFTFKTKQANIKLDTLVHSRMGWAMHCIYASTIYILLLISVIDMFIGAYEDVVAVEGLKALLQVLLFLVY